MTKKLSEQKLIGNFNATMSALLEQNNLSEDNFDKLFPDIVGNYKYYSYKNTIPAFSVLKNTDKFKEFIERNKNKHIVIAGDYDCDGVMSILIMYLSFRELGINVSYVVPNRLIDGYGLSKRLIDEAINMKADAIITVDNGISAKDEVAYALEQGLDVFITDHHIATEGCVPENVPIVDPIYNDDTFPNICGAFVALKLCYQLGISVTNQYLFEELATFAAIATVTDLMPTFSENRLLLRASFNYVDFIKNKNIWNRVRKLISGSGASYYLKDPDILADESLYGFSVGPMVNAVSRVSGDPTDLIQNIIDCDQMGVFIKDEFFQANKNRKDYTKDLLQGHKKNDDPINIELLNDSNYSYPIGGLLGLFANKIADEENKPALIGMEKEDTYEFSARSIPSYSIHDAFERIKVAHPEFNLGGGGHASAMGIRMPNDPKILEAFKQELCDDFKTYNKTDASKTLIEYEPAYLPEIIGTYSQLGVFGNGFRKLKFTYTGIITDYDPFYKIAIIDGIQFKAFFGDEIAEKMNTEITVNFDILLTASGVPTFRLVF